MSQDSKREVHHSRQLEWVRLVMVGEVGDSAVSCPALRCHLHLVVLVGLEGLVALVDLVDL